MKCLECEGKGGFEHAGSAFASCLACDGTGNHPMYLQGDATRPVLGDRPVLIAHVCNSVGGWGRGFVLAVSNRWPQPEAAYRKWHREGRTSEGAPFALGQIQVVPVTDKKVSLLNKEGASFRTPALSVVNMIAQAGYGAGNTQKHQSKEPNSTIPFRPKALESCLEKVATVAREIGATIHMPRIGTGLGGSSWEVIEPIVAQQLSGIPVTVYDYVP